MDQALDDDETIGYSIRMSWDHKTATITFRANEELTVGAMIKALNGLADQLKEDCKHPEFDQ